MDLPQHSTTAEALTRQIAEMIAAGRTTVAHPLLAALRHIALPSAEITELSVTLAIRESRQEDARDELDCAIDIEPAHGGLRKLRAQLRGEFGDLPGALQDAAEAVVLDRSDPAAKALLGLLMLQLGNGGDAAACLADAVALSPTNPWFREGLAAAQEKAGEPAAAAATLAAGIAASPGRIELRNAAILLSVRHRDFETAVRLADEARSAGIADACLFGLQGHALSSLGQHEAAGDAYREALKLGPHDPYVRHLVASAGFLPGATRAPAEYLSTIFDGYADRFEAHLITLGYRVPGLIRAALMQHFDLTERPITQPEGPVLDLGCGTGLLAVVLADLPFGPFTGVDLSARMLDQARSKDLYTELQEADLVQFLGDTNSSWKLILASDVLCYFGALENVLAAVFARLQPGGTFLFSTEELRGDTDGRLPANLRGEGGWSLGRQGRYAHTADYLRQAVTSAGFTINFLRQEVLRSEADMPVEGFLIMAERRGHER